MKVSSGVRAWRTPNSNCSASTGGSTSSRLIDDAGATPDYPPGYPPHREMEIYTKMGMTPEQVITAATKGGAEALRLDAEMGTLEAGKLANLLVLDADPRTDIRNTRRIARVYLQGREVDRAAMRKRWNPVATR